MSNIPLYYIKARTFSNINPYPSWKRDSDYWEKDASNNLFYMAANIGIGYPIPAGKLVIDGNVGIGTNNPQAKLDIRGNLFLNDGTVSNPALTFNSDTNTGIYRSGNDILGFVTGGSERMRIGVNGNVGVGTNNPQATLHINGNMQLTTSSQNIINSGNTQFYQQTISNSKVRLGAYDSILQYMPISINDGWLELNNGNVGIGISNPQAKLQVNSSIRSGNIVSARKFTSYYHTTGTLNTSQVYSVSISQFKSSYDDTTITVQNGYYFFSIYRRDGNPYQRGGGLISVYNQFTTISVFESSQLGTISISSGNISCSAIGNPSYPDTYNFELTCLGGYPYTGY